MLGTAEGPVVRRREFDNLPRVTRSWLRRGSVAKPRSRRWPFRGREIGGEKGYVFLRSSALEAACARLNSATFEAMIAYRRPVCEPEFRRPNKYHAVLDSGHRVLEIRRLMDGER
jgi:hypothetical protein